MSLLVRALIAVLALLWPVAMTSESAVAADADLVICSYNAPSNSATPTYDHVERDPPIAAVVVPSAGAVDPGSHGASARFGAAAIYTYTTYNRDCCADR